MNIPGLNWVGCSLLLTFSSLSVGAIDFNRDVRPILADHCLECHGVDEAARKADLRLDEPESAFSSRDGVVAIVPGAPQESELVRRIFTPDPDDIMPPPDHPRSLSESDRRILRDWIAQGAEYSQHWAFVAPQRPLPPTQTAGNHISRLQNPVDAFVFDRLQEMGLEPAGEADRATLIRRASLDLTGLPPTPGEIDAFLSDEDPQAWERVVDRLLASQRFGERMAMWWMDGARYADSHGFQADWERYQWPWRDWLINAFNDNQPFDEFTLDQLAGDLRPAATKNQILATGFHRNHRINTEGGSLNEEWLVENVIDRVETTGSVWLGLTLGCARCHDHKYDPITQNDFYSFFAFFYNIPEQGKGPGRQGNFEPVVSLPTQAQQSRIGDLRRISRTLTSQLASLTSQLDRITSSLTSDDPDLSEALSEIIKVPPEKRNKDQVKALEDFLIASRLPELGETRAELSRVNATLKKEEASVPSAMVLEEMAEPRQAYILIRGEYDKKGQPVDPAIPVVFQRESNRWVDDRLGLAQWIVSLENPLTARVQVNRFWEQLFGRALVASSENMGIQADFPSHPALLDWLAVEFMESGWDVKHILKTIVMSATYRQSAAVDEERLGKDPTNEWLSRGARFRVQAEMVRDQSLFLSGLLVEKLGGPGVYPYQPDGIWSEFNFYGNLRNYKPATDDGLYRRSLYTIWKRTAAPPAMTLFDMPNREICVVKRSRTNTPLQALALMNDITYVEASRHFASRIDSLSPGSISEWVSLAFRMATSRHPHPDEVTLLVEGFERRRQYYLSDQSAAVAYLSQGQTPSDFSGLNEGELARRAALATTASLILNLDETLNR